MKIITFFSEKGGVGKTSFNMLLASWLNYKFGIRVGVADFNFRLTGYRQAEIYSRQAINKEHPEIPLYDTAKAWPIIEAKQSTILEYKKNNDFFPYASWLSDQIHGGALSDKQVVICDFPGSLSGGEFNQILKQKLLNLVVIPIERDIQTVQSTLKLHGYLSKYNFPHCIFINRAQLGLKNMRSSYYALAKRLLDNNYPLLPDMISSTEKMSTIDKVDIVRSTFQYLDFSDSKAGDYGFENLFIDVVRELDRCPDLPNTAPTDLSFVKGLKKTDDGRQLKGTPFKDYEI